MADESGLSSAFPPPPKQFELFTSENVEAFKRDPASVPDHVARAMQPPEIPVQPYSIFGETWQLEERIPSLEEAGVQRLYPQDYNLVDELQKLSHSLLLNFLELVTIMSTAPEVFPPKVENLRLIMVNMHHLINSYRPHQTRESLIEFMEAQIARREAQVAAVESVTAEANGILEKYRALMAPIHVEAIHQEPDRSTLSGKQVMNGVQDECKEQDLYLFEQLALIS